MTPKKALEKSKCGLNPNLFWINPINGSIIAQIIKHIPVNISDSVSAKCLFAIFENFVLKRNSEEKFI